jgi:hypothetical protein
MTSDETVNTRKSANNPPPGQAGVEEESWKVDLDSMGWLTILRVLPHEEGDPLSKHGDWTGPVKMIETANGMIQRIDIHRGAGAVTYNDAMLGEEDALAAGGMVKKLLARAGDWFAGGNGLNGWTPPSSKMLCEWIVRTGREAAVDEAGHLHLTLKRQGCDGQVRITRRENHLRFTMPFGRFSRLEPQAKAAMAKLAAEANAGCRLARIARLVESRDDRYEAQVDLTGLPWGDTPDSATLSMWAGTVRMAVLSLDLALRRLGHELPLLAEARESELARWIENRRNDAMQQRNAMTGRNDTMIKTQ